MYRNYFCMANVFLSCNIADLDELELDENNNNVVHTENEQNEIKQVNTYHC